MAFYVQFGVLSAAVHAGTAISIPPGTEIEVAHGRSVVIASHARRGARIELSITVATSGAEPLRTRVALVDGQRFTIAPGGDGPDATRYAFRRTGQTVELTLLSGDSPIRPTLEMSSLVHGADGTGRPARQASVKRATRRR